MILIEVVEKPARADGVLRDLEIVDVLFPVFAHLIDRRHGETILSPGTIGLTAGLNGPLRFQ
jgi:hypothetical protein